MACLPCEPRKGLELGRGAVTLAPDGV